MIQPFDDQRFINTTTMRYSALIILLLASAVQGEVLSLTEANYAEKTAGKTVFLKVRVRHRILLVNERMLFKTLVETHIAAFLLVLRTMVWTLQSHGT
jgi:hypothetical protein